MNEDTQEQKCELCHKNKADGIMTSTDERDNSKVKFYICNECKNKIFPSIPKQEQSNDKQD